MTEQIDPTKYLESALVGELNLARYYLKEAILRQKQTPSGRSECIAQLAIAAALTGLLEELVSFRKSGFPVEIVGR